MAGGQVTWSSKRQTTIALSTVEAEYVVMSRAAQQMVWMQSWLSEVEVEFSVPGLISGDSQGAITLTKNTKDHSKVKHIDIQHHRSHPLTMLLTYSPNPFLMTTIIIY